MTVTALVMTNKPLVMTSCHDFVTDFLALFSNPLFYDDSDPENRVLSLKYTDALVIDAKVET
jgi:hypothetical protein